MLGYVKPLKPELKIKDYEAYRGYYCSLCKALGKKYGILSRLFLSYDVTFFVVFLYAQISNTKPCFRNGRCPFNPLKKCSYTDVKTDIYDFAAAFSVIMSYYKIKDNILDASFFKGFKFRIIYPFVYFRYKKAKRNIPVIDEIIGKSIVEQIKLESEGCSISDKAADPSAKALGECFRLYSDKKENESLFYRFGYCLGRYVYLIDAFDDMKKDSKNKCYNVFINNGYSDEQIAESIRMSINELVENLDRFEFNLNKDIISNIIKQGLDAQLCLIIKRRREENEQKSV